MNSWQSGDVTVNGLRIHYTRTGYAGKPPVVLAHGFSDDGLCWTPVAEALASDYEVILVDARGHGRSESTGEAYGQTEMAEDLNGVIGALGLQRPAILGHSMGASTTLLLAGLHPDVPRAILLEDPGASWVATTENEASQAKRWEGMRNWITRLQGKTREELIAEQAKETPHWSEAELGPWADAKLRLSLDVLQRNPGAPIDWQSLLARITCPVLLITADPARGAIITPESAASLQAAVPHLRIAPIPEAGHSIRRDRFETYMQVVCAFLGDTLQ